MTGFTNRKLKIEDWLIDVDIAGRGPALLLLHGFPETKFAWNTIAPHLPDSFTVVVPDLPGYGGSTGAIPLPGNENYSKRSMADVLVQMMSLLGFSEYSVAGHDRGGRVAYRMALDHPGIVKQLAVLNIVPTLEMVERINYDLAKNMENWFFLSQPSPFPETLIAANPGFFLDHILNSWSISPEKISQQARENYLKNFTSPQTVSTICAEYRAIDIDISHDREDKANNRRIQCPVMTLWSKDDILAGLESPIAIWKDWADEATGKALSGGHFLMEESTEEVLKAFEGFFMVTA